MTYEQLVERHLNGVSCETVMRNELLRQQTLKTRECAVVIKLKHSRSPKHSASIMPESTR